MGRVVDTGSAVPVTFSDEVRAPAAAGSGSVGGGEGVSSGPVAGAAAGVASFRSWLASVDSAALSDRERVDLVAELEAVKGAASACQARATDALRCSREVVAPRDVARSVGASAKFAGSGGAICGLYHSGRQYQELVDALASIRCTVLRPMIFES